MKRPCKCGCVDLKHEPCYMRFSGNVNLDRIYKRCYLCERCIEFVEMPNLQYLEWCYDKKRKGAINV